MKHLWTLVIVFVLATSCQFFETERISTETFYKEDLKSIDWKDVDQYPVFKECEDNADKAMQRSCFEKALQEHLHQSFTKRNIVAMNDLNDTVQLSFSIDRQGKLSIKNIKIDSMLQKEFPLLKDWIFEGVDTLNPLAPAYKRGIPVLTEFTLPIIIKTQEL